MYCGVVPILFGWFLRVKYHPYMHLFSFGKLSCDFTNVSNHPPNGVESTCEGSVMPGGLCAARAKEQHTNTVRISVMKDKSIEIKISVFGSALPTNITAQRNNHSHHTHLHTHKLHVVVISIN